MIFLQILMSLSPVLTFAFYQWTLKDSWLAVFLSVITSLSLLAGMIFFGIVAYRGAREDDKQVAYGPLHGSFRAPRHWFYWILLSVLVFKSIIVGFGQKNGTVQIALLFTLEAGLFLALIILKPHTHRRTDALQIFFSAVRLVSSALLVTFITSLGVKPIPRVVIGLATAVILSVAVVVAFLDLLKALLPWHLIRRRSKKIEGHSGDSSIKSPIEKEVVCAV